MTDRRTAPLDTGLANVGLQLLALRPEWSRIGAEAVRRAIAGEFDWVVEMARAEAGDRIAALGAALPPAATDGEPDALADAARLRSDGADGWTRVRFGADQAEAAAAPATDLAALIAAIAQLLVDLAPAGATERPDEPPALGGEAAGGEEIASAAADVSAARPRAETRRQLSAGAKPRSDDGSSAPAAAQATAAPTGRPAFPLGADADETSFQSVRSAGAKAAGIFDAPLAGMPSSASPGQVARAGASRPEGAGGAAAASASPEGIGDAPLRPASPRAVRASTSLDTALRHRRLQPSQSRAAGDRGAPPSAVDPAIWDQPKPRIPRVGAGFGAPGAEDRATNFAAGPNAFADAGVALARHPAAATTTPGSATPRLAASPASHPLAGSPAAAHAEADPLAGIARALADECDLRGLER